MSDKIELTGEQLLEMLSETVAEDYGEIIERWIEKEDANNNVWACFKIKDKVGVVKVLIEAEVNQGDNK